MQEVVHTELPFELPPTSEMLAMLRATNRVYAAAIHDRPRTLLLEVLTLLGAAAVAAWTNATPLITLAAAPPALIRRRRAFILADSTVERLHAQPVPRDRVVHHYSPLSGAAGGTAPLGAAMCSRSSFDGIPSLLAVYKAAGAEHFAGRACQILRSLHIQCGWALNRAVKAATDMPRLTPRGRDVLKLLLAGHTELVIAQKLGLSRHTVHSHCKRVYREFNVSTRGELLAHFVRRNGIGGLPASGNGRA